MNTNVRGGHTVIPLNFVDTFNTSTHCGKGFPASTRCPMWIQPCASRKNETKALDSYKGSSFTCLKAFKGSIIIRFLFLFLEPVWCPPNRLT